MNARPSSFIYPKNAWLLENGRLHPFDRASVFTRLQFQKVENSSDEPNSISSADVEEIDIKPIARVFHEGGRVKLAFGSLTIELSREVPGSVELPETTASSRNGGVATDMTEGHSGEPQRAAVVHAPGSYRKGSFLGQDERTLEILSAVRGTSVSTEAVKQQAEATKTKVSDNRTRISFVSKVEGRKKASGAIRRALENRFSKK